MSCGIHVCRNCRQSGSPGPSSGGPSSSQTFSTQHNGPREARRSQEKWILAPRSPEKRLSVGSGRQSVSKSREILSIIADNGEAEAEVAAAVEAAQAAHSSGGHVGIMTRARKRKLLDLAAADSSAAADAVIKRSKMDGKQALAKGGADRQLRGTTNRRSSKGGGKAGASIGEPDRAGQSSSSIEGGEAKERTEEAVISHEQWIRERDERDSKFPATICNKSPVSHLIKTGIGFLVYIFVF